MEDEKKNNDTNDNGTTDNNCNENEKVKERFAF